MAMLCIVSFRYLHKLCTSILHGVEELISGMGLIVGIGVRYRGLGLNLPFGVYIPSISRVTEKHQKNAKRLQITTLQVVQH